MTDAEREEQIRLDCIATFQYPREAFLLRRLNEARAEIEDAERLGRIAMREEAAQVCDNDLNTAQGASLRLAASQIRALPDAAFTTPSGRTE